jgi:hypothetical protein
LSQQAFVDPLMARPKRAIIVSGSGLRIRRTLLRVTFAGAIG